MARTPRPPSGQFARDTDRLLRRLRRELFIGGNNCDSTRVEQAIAGLLRHINATRQVHLFEQFTDAIREAREACA